MKNVKLANWIILISLITFVFNDNLQNLRSEKEFQSRSVLMSSSTFSSFSTLNGGKPERHIRSVKTEQFRDQNGEEPEEVRNYGELFIKDNNDPALLRKKASTNVEDEDIILDTEPEEKTTLDKKNEKKFFSRYNDGSKDRFDHRRSNMYILSNTSRNFFNGFEEDFDHFNTYKHGDYDKFLESRKNKLMEKIKSRRKH